MEFNSLKRSLALRAWIKIRSPFNSSISPGLSIFFRFLILIPILFMYFAPSMHILYHIVHKNTNIKTHKTTKNSAPYTFLRRAAQTNLAPYHSPRIIGVARYSTVLSLSASYRMATCILIFLFSTVIYSESIFE